MKGDFLMKKKIATILMICLLMAMATTFVMADSINMTIMYQSGGADDIFKDWMDENVKIFLKEHPNINFEIISNSTGDNYLTQITSRIAAGNAPDVFQGWTLGRMEPFAKADRLHNIGPAIENDQEFNSYLQKEPLKATTFNGKIYGVPLELAVEIVFYNKTVFKELGLAIPETYEDFMNIVDVCKENDIIPIALGNTQPWVGTIVYMMLAERYGGLEAYEATVMEGTGKWTDEPFIKAAEELQNLIEIGAFEPNVNGIAVEEARAKFVDGKAAMYFMGTWDMVFLTDKMSSDGFGMFNFPDIKGGKGSKNHYIIIPNIAYSVGNNSQHKEEAVEFLKFIFSPERQKEFVKMGNIPASTVKIDPEQGQPVQVQIIEAMNAATGSMYPWDVPLGPAMGKQLNNAIQRIYAGESPEQVLKQLQRIDESE
jgi:raffinose/stachyose/melibiose transport system substrate-binding protein